MESFVPEKYRTPKSPREEAIKVYSDMVFDILWDSYTRASELYKEMLDGKRPWDITLTFDENPMVDELIKDRLLQFIDDRIGFED